MHVYIRQLSNISRGNGIKTVCVCVWGGGGVTGDNMVHTCIIYLSIAGSEPGRLHPPPSGRPCHNHLRDNSSHSTHTIS